LGHGHTLLKQTGIYSSNHEKIANFDLDDLRKIASTGKDNQIMQGLHRYAANLPGTDGFWYKQTTELRSAMVALGCPTLFYTLSMADLHWPDLLRLLPWPPEFQLDSLAELPSKERSRVVRNMINKNAHLVAWYFHTRLNEFREHMHNILDATWSWDRTESQFRRGALHAHGTLKMRQDHDLTANSRAALLGFLAKKKLAHLKAVGIQHEPSWFKSKKNLFTLSELIAYDNDAKPMLTELRIAYQKDKASHPNSIYKWYIGVSSESNPATLASVLLGRHEFKSANQSGLSQPSVVFTTNHMLAGLAWTTESRFVSTLLGSFPSNLTNKSDTFGMGKLPANWSKNTRYTLSLIRGRRADAAFNAYGDLPSGEESLNAIISKGQECEEKVKHFVDFLISTMNPRDLDTQCVHPAKHPSQLDPSEISNLGPDLDNENLINTLQRPHKHSTTYCLRKRKKDGSPSCRFHFPKVISDETHLVFEPHGRSVLITKSESAQKEMIHC
jgi:hypothetical protein